MKTIKRFLSIFAMLAVLASAMIIPNSYSYMIDWEMTDYNAYFRYDYGVDVAVKETVEKSGDVDVKQDVYVQNTGESSCYVKVMIAFAATGTQLALPNLSERVLCNHYDIQWNTESIDYSGVTNKDDKGKTTGARWLAVNTALVQDSSTSTDTYNNEEFYPVTFIWNTPLEVGDGANDAVKTANLINSLKQTIEENTDYNITVEIIADGIYEGEINEWFETYGITWENENGAAGRTLKIAS